jgi:hypothetical protein
VARSWKFSDEQTKEIRRKYEDGESMYDLMEVYDASRATIRRAIVHAGGEIRGTGPLKVVERVRTPKSFEDLQTEILRILPNATFSKDSTGQIIINTGLKIVMVETLAGIED